MQNNNMPACASCKHQRKRCTEKCTLAPFFPAEKSREFQAVHKVFGVSNITKMVKSLNVDDRRRAIESLVWEAFWRQKDPVMGLYGEYRKVSEELRFYRTQFQHQHSAVYKPTPCFVNNNNNNIISHSGVIKSGTSVGGGGSGMLNYVHSNGSSIIDSNPYNNFSSSNHQILHAMERGTQEEDAGYLAQQHPIDGLSQQYYILEKIGENLN